MLMLNQSERFVRVHAAMLLSALMYHQLLKEQKNKMFPKGVFLQFQTIRMRLPTFTENHAAR